MECVLKVPAVELPAPAFELWALGWELPPQLLDPEMTAFELPAPVLELPLPCLHHPAQPNKPLSKPRQTKQTPKLK